MKLDIRTIPHNEQRYDTAGDYYEEGGTTNFRISKLGDSRYEQLVLIHELVEYFLVKLAGIPLSKIDEFDKSFESDMYIEDGLLFEENWGEPGDSPQSPYYRQHQMASIVERMCAFFFNVKWVDYDGAVLNLEYGTTTGEAESSEEG